MSLTDFTAWLGNTAMSQGINRSVYVYPLIEGTHVLSLTLAVGTILWFDLRLLGVILRREPLARMYASLRPWIFTGFALMAVTGVLLFINRPTAIAQNHYFQAKLILLLLSLINILIYHRVIERNSSTWDNAEIPPTAARVAGGLSIALWFAIITVGRFMAYSL